ncbi:hypothetical protein OsI_33676 [Oryza sativa Indica Group]|uniref:MATH domain-containing protein n=1 Tax=Oryza sativa subsp. indica TaxID=39946 RepID=A2Z7J5_ORYSI|nr:hypothetical protein OsI_33676 [Oryza sativa Indica Group]
MSPAACRGNPSRSASASAVVVDTATGYHLLKIEGYSLTKGIPTSLSLKSSQFTVGGYRWRIDYFSNGDCADSADYISLFLSLDERANKDVKSPVFRAELYSSMKEGDTAGVVRIEDMEAQVFKLLLRFVYTDSLPEMGNDDEDVMCQHLLVAADRYNLERLKLIYEEKLCSYISVDAVSNILALADQHHCDGLKKACFHFLASPGNLNAVITSDGLKHLSRSFPSLMEELVAMLAPLLSHALVI